MKQSLQFRVFVSGCLVASALSTSGCSWLLGEISIGPPSGQPIVCNNYVVFAPPTNSNRLSCIDLQGRKIWEREYPTDICYSRRGDSSVVVQAGMDISVVDVPTGSETPLFKTRTEHEVVHFGINGSLAYSKDKRLKHQYFRMLDPESGAVLWEREDMGSVILALEDVIIFLTSVDSPDFEHSPFASAAEALDSKSGKRVWKTPLPEGFSPSYTFWLHPVYVAPHIVIADVNKLICLRTDNGQIVSTIDLPKDHGSIGPVISSNDGLLVYAKTEGHVDKPPPGGYRTIVRLYSLPDLKRESVTELSTAAPIAAVMCHDQYIIARVWDPTFGIVCFDAKTGQQTWLRERGFGLCSEPANGKIYFSDFGNWKDIPFRVGVIDIPSGNETILYEEQMPADDSGS